MLVQSESQDVNMWWVIDHSNADSLWLTGFRTCQRSSRDRSTVQQVCNLCTWHPCHGQVTEGQGGHTQEKSRGCSEKQSATQSMPQEEIFEDEARAKASSEAGRGSLWSLVLQRQT